MSAACFIQSPTCVLDWDGINAIATFSAAAIALAATGVAVWLPRWTRLRDRSDTTNEIMGAVGEAIDLFHEANRHMGNSTSPGAIKVLGAKASYLCTALDRMISRPELTDGAIIVAAGAIQLLGAIEAEAAKYREEKDLRFARMIVSDLTYFVGVVPIILERAQRVAAYAVKRRWPKWRTRFAHIAKEGLRPESSVPEKGGRWRSAANPSSFDEHPLADT